MAIDMKQLKTDIKAQAQACVEAKKAFREAQRALSTFQRENKTYTWDQYKVFLKSMDCWRSNAAFASEMMTKLCVFKAHLRGRKHLTENSVWNDQVVGWIADLEERYALKEAA